jgi:hypothetical protein
LHTRTATLTDDWGAAAGGWESSRTASSSIHHLSPPPGARDKVDPTTRDRAEDVRTGTRGDETRPKGRGREKDPTGGWSMPSGVADPACAPPGKKRTTKGEDRAPGAVTPHPILNPSRKSVVRPAAPIAHCGVISSPIPFAPAVPRARTGVLAKGGWTTSWKSPVCPDGWLGCGLEAWVEGRKEGGLSTGDGGESEGGSTVFLRCWGRGALWGGGCLGCLGGRRGADAVAQRPRAQGSCEMTGQVPEPGAGARGSWGDQGG